MHAAPPLVSPSGAGTVIIGPQAMEGNLQIHPGDALRAGFDFTMPGSHPGATATFSSGYVLLLVKCADGSTPPLTIQLTPQTITDPAGSSSWYPSGDQSSPPVYQGALTAPDLCAGGVMNDAAGALFTTNFFSTDTLDKVNFRFHYSDSTAGGWSGTVQGTPTPFANTITSATLTPTLSLGLAADHTAAGPSDTINYTATVTNTGSTLSVGGDFLASATGTGTATVASYWDEVSTSLDGNTWTALGGAAASTTGYTPAVGPPIKTGMTLSATSVAAVGVTYPASGDPLLATSIASGGTAQWHYTATLNLSAAQAASLFDPTKVKKIRNSFHLEVTPANPNVTQPAIVNLDFSQLFYGGGASASLAKVMITIQPPSGAPLQFNSTTSPALATLASGQSASVSGPYVVPAPPTKAAGQSDSDYFAALSALEGALLKATASASATAATGAVSAPAPAPVTAVEHLPIVSITKSGPANVTPGTNETNPLALKNSGGATALALSITDSVPGGGSGTVTGVPATLAAGASASATATFPVPASQPSGNLTDTASLTWQDANTNPYGPVSSSFTTNVVNPFAGATLALAPTAAGPNVPGSVQTLTATLLDVNKQPIPNQPISFSITGANPKSGTAVTDANGTATFTYTGFNAGTDSAQATFTAPGVTISSNASAITWLQALQPVTTTVVQGNFFRNDSGICHFGVGPGSTPVFSQNFPDIMFNPDPAIFTSTPPFIRPDSNGVVFNISTRPLTDVTTDGNGNPNGQLVAAGNGIAAGSDLISFFASFTGSFVINQPGDVTFRILHDDGYILGVGGGASRVSGDFDGDTVPAASAFNGYPTMAAWNTSSTGSSSSGTSTIHFPTSGLYPFEIDYTECGGGPLFLDLLTEKFNPQSSPLSVYVGYADGLRPAGSIFPFPWDGSPGVTFYGCPAPCQYDGGTIRIDNSGSTAAIIDSLTVDIPFPPPGVNDCAGVTHFDIWPHNITIPAGQSLIVAPMAPGTTCGGDLPFDTSDTSFYCGPDTGVIPLVNVTIAGVTTTYQDKTQVLNTAGRDQADCGGNESESWQRIGGGGTAVNLPLPPGATLNVTPFNVPNAVQGQSITETVSALDGAGNPVVNLPVQFQVFGANPQTLPTKNTDSFGLVTFTYPGNLPGTDTVQASAFIGGLRSISNQGTIVWAPPGGNTNNPLGATITNPSPADGSIVTKPVPVNATIAPPSGQTIVSWRVFYQALDPGPQVVIGSGTGTPPSPLGVTFDPTVLPNDTYGITIEATASNGAVQDVATTVIVIGSLKPGRYTTSYQDLSVLVGGFQMSVLRTYDSIDKSSGDFGIGWKVDITNLRVATNHIPGLSGWTQYNKSCVLGLCFTAFKSSAPRFLTVTFPDQHTEIFDFTPDGGTNVFWGCTPKFTARTGTTSSLTPLDDTSCSYNGDGNIYGSNGFYNPQRFKLTTKTGSVLVLDAKLGLVSQTDPNGNSINVDSGGVHFTLGPASSPTAGPSITFTRDVLGRITDVNGPVAGQHVHYSYFGSANELQTVTDPNGNVDTYAYDPASGDLASVTGPGSTPISALTYDASGRLQSVSTNGSPAVTISTSADLQQQTYTDPNGALTVVLTYDSLGDVVQEDDVFNGQKLTSKFQYDAVGRVTDAIDPAGNETQTQYDESATSANGNVLSVTQVNLNRTWSYQNYNSFGEPGQLVNPDGSVMMTLTYDPNTAALLSSQVPGQPASMLSYWPSGQLKQQVDPAGRQINYTYDSNGNLASVSDGSNPPLQVSYDAAGLLRTVTDPVGNQTRYDYWPSGQLKTLTNGRNNVWQYFYDSLDRLDHVTDPLLATTQYHYNAAGQLDRVTDRNNAVTSYVYDVDGNLIQENRPGGDVLHFGYDPIGRLIEADSAASHIDRSYDAAGRLQSETSCANTGSPTIPCPAPGTGGGPLPTDRLAYQYWPDGQIEQASSSDSSNPVNYTYDVDGRLHSVSDPTNPNASFIYGYDPAGRLSSFQLPNGIVSKFSYDLSSSLTGIDATLNGSLVANFDYQIDPLTGRRTQLNDSAGQHTFSYFANGTLKSETHPAGSGLANQSYTYDAAENRSTGSVVSQFDAADRLQTDGTYNYVFDGEGNLKSKTPVGGGPGTTYVWNSDHQLVSITYPDGTKSMYQYDALGRRVRSDDPSRTTTFVYDGLQVHADYNGQGQLQNAYLPGLESVSGNTAAYYLRDGLGTVRNATDSSGSIIGSGDFSAWGLPAPQNTAGNRYSFTGYQYDSASGLYYTGARYYDPNSGRFLSEDPLPATNAYPLAGSDPVNQLDFMGAGAIAEYALLLSDQATSAQCIAGYVAAVAGVAIGATALALAGMAVDAKEVLAAIAVSLALNAAMCALSSLRGVCGVLIGATGSFLILNWSGYPTVGGVPKPNGPFRLIEGAEYQSARDAANTANAAEHAADPSLNGLQLHEIKPVKFGGNPTDLGNKFPLTQAEHTPYTNWWNKLQRCLEAA